MILEYIHKALHNVSKEEYYKAYKLFFNTFSSEQRLKILNLLREKERNVSEIIKETRFEQSVVSHNLRRLKSCGFVIQEIKGKYRYYKLNEVTIKPILSLIDKHMQKKCFLIIKKKKKGK